MSFRSRLKQLRESAGLDQQTLADKAGMSKGGIRHLEQGTRIPNWDTVQKLAKALGVSVEAFQGADDEEDEPPKMGRPPKPKDDDSDQAAEPPEKRGRGRPAKPASEEPPAPKKPRGRPRKGE